MHLQKTVGTVVKTTDSVDPIAVMTVLPLRRYASLACVQEIKSYLQAKCNSKTEQSFQQVSYLLSTVYTMQEAVLIFWY